MPYSVPVNNERISILYANAFSGNITVLLSSLIFAYLLRDPVSASILISWLLFMHLVSYYRFWLLSDYNKNKNKVAVHEKYETRYTNATGLIGIGWAAIIFTGINQPVFEYRIYSILLLTAIIAISVPIFSSSIKTIIYYISPAMLFNLPVLLLNGGNDTALALALIIFSAMVIRAGINNHNTLIKAITLRINSQELNEELSKLHIEKVLSEERMQGIMDYAPTAIYVKDLDGHFTFGNKKVADLHEMTRAELIGKTLFDILPRNVAEVINNNDIAVYNSATPMKYEEKAPQADGMHHYISIKFPLFNDNGDIYAVGGVSTDITERVRIEESLRISQQRLLLHREQSPVGIIEWNTNFEVTDWNPAAEKIFGFTKEETLGLRISDKITPENIRPDVNKVWQELLSQNGGSYSLNENLTKDGRTILCEWHYTPLIDDKGNVIAITSLVDDVTKRQMNEINLRHNQKMDAIGKLTGGIAHDFNNMLGIILGFSELLRQQIPKDNAKLIQYDDQIIIAAEKARKLTSKLLEFSRKTPSSNEMTYITTLLEDMRHMLEKTLTARIQLSFDFKNDIWPVWLDPSRLEDAIINISINSMHAMPSGGMLTLSLENTQLADNEKNMNLKAGDYVKLSIRDNGTGMPDEVKEKIFDPFFTTKGTEGTGLGLSQVYGFLQQSKCGIYVDSKEEQGTEISIYIPRYKNKEKHNTSSNKKSINPVTGTETILIVDDEPILLELTQEILENYGYTVFKAERAKEALDILKHESIDLLISDVIMPEMDGYQLATEVEKIYPNVKIQIVSGYSEESKTNLINKNLHENQLYKPLKADRLLNRIREILDNK